MDYRKLFVVEAGKKLRLKDRDPTFKGRHQSHETAAAELDHYREKLAHQQSLMYAEKKHALLIVLQAVDAGGKDGAVNHVFTALNPQGATSPASSSRRRWSSNTISYGVSIRTRRQRGGWRSSIALITKTCSSPGCTSSSIKRPGERATTGFAISRRSWSRAGPEF